jgi:uncharacterized protein
MQVDRVISRIKQHPLVVLVMALGAVVVSLSTFTDAAKKLFDVLAPHGREAARSELSKMSLQYAPEIFVESAKKGDIHAVKLFLAAGMNPNARDGDELTGLMWAVRENHALVIDALLKAKADVNERSWRGDTALSWAAAGGNQEVLRVLLDKGANAEAINGAFVTAARK